MENWNLPARIARKIGNLDKHSCALWRKISVITKGGSEAIAIFRCPDGEEYEWMFPPDFELDGIYDTRGNKSQREDLLISVRQPVF